MCSKEEAESEKSQSTSSLMVLMAEALLKSEGLRGVVSARCEKAQHPTTPNLSFLLDFDERCESQCPV